MSKVITWLFLRLVTIVALIPLLQRNLFAPFLYKTGWNFFDPWSYWLEAGGRKDAFPYGPVMYFFFLPGKLLDAMVRNIPAFSNKSKMQIWIALSLLIIDFFLLKLMGVFTENEKKFWSWSIVCSPVLIYISFAQGQLDLVPSFLLFIAVTRIREKDWRRAGLWLGLGIASKFSLILVLPFIAIYFASSHSKKKEAVEFLLGLSPSLLFGFLPALWSNGFRTMVLGTPEVLKSLTLSIPIGRYHILLLPITYLVLFIWLWNLKRVTPEILSTFVGVSMIVVASFQFLSIGWFLWGLPIVFLTLKSASRRTLFLLITWQTCLLFLYATDYPADQARFFSLSKNLFLGTPLERDTLLTLALLTISTIVAKLLTDTIKKRDPLKLSRGPISVAISGDSGVGKDTLTKAIATYVGQEGTSILLGDDYHLFERNDISWSSLTHLNPEANNLDAMGQDFRSLLNRKKIIARHYDHRLGKFTAPREIESTDFILVNGLHSQLISEKDSFDLRIFLEMEEELRIKLKLARDSKERGIPSQSSVLKSIKERKKDFLAFVFPQKQNADLTFKVSAISFMPLRTEIMISSRNSNFLRKINTAILALTPCNSNLQIFGGQSHLVINAELFEKRDSEKIIRYFLPNFDQLFPSSDGFLSGDSGLMATLSIILLSERRMMNNA